MKVNNGNLTIFKYALILLLPSLAFSGILLYYSNQALQIPLIHKLYNPSLYPNDPFVDTLPSYPSILWKTIAFS